MKTIFLTLCGAAMVFAVTGCTVVEHPATHTETTTTTEEEHIVRQPVAPVATETRTIRAY